MTRTDSLTAQRAPLATPAIAAELTAGLNASDAFISPKFL
jgi:hypothetical protein